MKIRLSHSTGEQGTIMLLTIVITGLVGFLLAAYLGLIRSQNYATMRSQAWNGSVPVIEAGIEDALTHLNAHGPTNLNCDGWTLTGSQYVMSRTVGDNFYTVTISNLANPVVYSRGYVQMPAQYSSTQPSPAPAAFLASVAGNVTGAKTYMARGVRVTTRGNGLFTKAMVAKGTIGLSGGIVTDSFNSEDPALSTSNQYDPSKWRDKGDVASNGSLTKEINSSGNVRIYGHLSTGPSGTVGFSGSSVMGSRTWIEAGNAGIQPGWFTDDMNVNFSDVETPSIAGTFTPGAGTVNGTSYSYVIGEGRWVLPSINLSSKNAIIITSTNAELYVTGNVSLSGQAYIYIAPGASLKLYVGGSTTTLSGQGIANATGQAKNFFYYGLPTNKTINLSGNAAFIGVIYAPSAVFNMSGGGNDPTDFVGASITGTVSMSGNYKFHYDESLATYGPSKGYVVTSWNEMTPQEIGATVVTVVPPQ